MRKLMLTFLLALFATLLLAQATDLFISEYVEGSSYRKAIEIFNGTGSPVDLSIYSLKKQTNGAGEFGNELALSGTLENSDVFVIVYDHGGDGDLTENDFVDMATSQQTLSFNGNDAVALCKNGDLLDVIGVVDSSTDWGKNMTLVRQSYVAAPTTTYVIEEWNEYPTDTFEYLGYHDFSGGTDPIISIISPNGGEQWEQASIHNITWNSINFDGNVQISLEMAYDMGKDRTVLVADTENDGEWEWEIPTDQEISDFYVIIIEGIVPGDPFDISNAAFSIIAPIQYTEYTIYDIQYSTDGPSPHADEQIMTTGVVTAIFASTYFIQDGQGAWNGICVFGTVENLTIGDKITIKATVEEYNDKTELKDVAELVNEGQFPIPQAESIITGDLATMEDYEGVLVKISNVTVTNDSLGYGEWEVDDFIDSSGPCRIDDLGEYTYLPENGDLIDSIIGVVEYSYGNYKLEPRNDDDFNVSENTNNVINTQKLSINAYPNPFISRNIKSDITVKYALSQSQNIVLSIYNMKGQLVKNLYTGFKSRGSYTTNWNGMDNSGNKVSAGIYFYRLNGENVSTAKKILILK